MSHNSVIKAQIKNIDTLKKACERLGFEFVEGQKQYKWFGRFVGDYPLPDGFTVEDLGKCEHAIKVPGADYEVGVVKDKYIKDDYKLIWDFWRGGGLEQKLGKEAWKLVQAYEAEQSKYAAKLKGKPVRETRLKDRTRIVIMMD